MWLCLPIAIAKAGIIFLKDKRAMHVGGETSASAGGIEESAEGISSRSPQQNQVDPGRQMPSSV
jgi:hypothetical protein